MRKRSIAPRGFLTDDDASAAVEFAIIAAPFVLLLLFVLQLGYYYMVQAALNTGVVRTADALRIATTTGASLTFPNSTQLKNNVATNAGALVQNNATLAVEIQPLTNLSSAATPIVDGTYNIGGSTSVLALRAQAQVTALAPMFTSLLYVRASAILRRQGT